MFNFLQPLVAELEGVSAEAFTYFKTNVLPVLERDAAALLTQLAPLAEKAVIQVATTGKVSTDARNQATSDLKTAAVSAGIDAANSLLDFAVQTAYSKLNATGALPTATAPVPAVEAAPAAPASS